MTPPSDIERDFPLTTDQVDPELLDLPDPPRKERRTTVALLLVAAVASMAMAWSLSRDAAYSLSSSTPLDLADLRIAPPTLFASNSYVQGEAVLGAAGAIRYEHPFESGSYRLARVAGRPNVWVEVRIPEGQESARYVPGTQFKGRLIPFSKAGLRHRGLAASVENLTGQPVARESWLIVDGQAPSDAKSVVALVVLFLGFAIWNLVTLVRLARKLSAST